MLKPISILSGLLRHYFDYISQDDNATAKVNAALDARYVCTNDLATSFANTEDSISPNDLMSFQWQIACGIVTFFCFSFFFYLGFLSQTLQPGNWETLASERNLLTTKLRALAFIGHHKFQTLNNII